MSTNTDTVKKINEAANQRNFDAIKDFIHEDYSLKDPVMELQGRDEFIDFMKNCPFEGKVEVKTMAEEGNKVIQIIDCVMSKPAKYTFHACDVLTFKDGKVIEEEMIYDTKSMPEEALEAEKYLRRKAA